MVPLGNDRWRSEVPIEEQGTYRFRVEGWIDSWATWRSELEKRLAAGQDVAVELKEGAGLVGDAARRARAAGVTGEADRLKAAAAGLRRLDPAKAGALATSGELNTLMGRHADRRRGTATSAEYVLVAARERARHGAWYELFPRSVSPKRGRHEGLGRALLAQVSPGGTGRRRPSAAIIARIDAYERLVRLADTSPSCCGRRFPRCGSRRKERRRRRSHRYLHARHDPDAFRGLRDQRLGRPPVRCPRRAHRRKAARHGRRADERERRAREGPRPAGPRRSARRS